MQELTEQKVGVFKMGAPVLSVRAVAQVIAAALILGLPLGFITNAPDQLKTNIQKGQFLNMCVASLLMYDVWIHVCV